MKTIENDKEAVQLPIGITVEGWDRVVQVICAYGYNFALGDEKSNEPSFGESLWDLVLSVFGCQSARQERNRMDAADWRRRREERMQLTHLIIGHIVKKAEVQLKELNFCELHLDYTGGGTAFYKADVRIERSEEIPNRFVVWIFSNYGLDGKFEQTLAAEHQFKLVVTQ